MIRLHNHLGGKFLDYGVQFQPEDHKEGSTWWMWAVKVFFPCNVEDIVEERQYGSIGNPSELTGLSVYKPGPSHLNHCFHFSADGDLSNVSQASFASHNDYSSYWPNVLTGNKSFYCVFGDGTLSHKSPYNSSVNSGYRYHILHLFHDVYQGNSVLVACWIQGDYRPGQSYDWMSRTFYAAFIAANGQARTFNSGSLDRYLPPGSMSSDDALARAMADWTESVRPQFASGQRWATQTLEWTMRATLVNYASEVSFDSFLPSYDPNVDVLFPKEDRNPPWGDIAASAYDQVNGFEGNGIAYVKDFTEMAEAVSSTISAIKSLRRPNPATIAKLFLSFHYGWKLTIADTKELVRAMNRTPRGRCSASTTYSAGQAHYQAHYSVGYDVYGQLEGELARLTSFFDLNLTPDNIWDMIPYSFVVDWFISIGDSLSKISNFYTLRQEHHVLWSCRSIKGFRSAPATFMGVQTFHGNVNYTLYLREYLDRPLQPSVFPSVTIGSLYKHFVEGTALIVSRR